ncbi:MAG: amidohydrolase family protein [Rubrivivax sp.]|nr:amidohydrolase family protein [Rubrivivax sp.]
MTRLLLQRVRVPGQAGACDLLVEDGRIARIESAGASSAPVDAVRLEGDGALALPGLVDAHAHLDKTLWGQPWHPHAAGPTLMDKITHEREELARRGHSSERASARILRHGLARGTTHWRTHVDVGPDIGLAHLHGVLAMREAHRDVADVQIVAFPQTGVMRAPGTLALLEQAVRDGTEVLGGLDPMGIDHDPRGQLDGLFGIAERHGSELDIHLHDRGDLGAVTVEMIAERCAALGLHGRVVLSHAFCLGMLEAARLEAIVELLLRHDIAVMSHAPSGPTPFPPLKLLHERGVRLCTGSDGVRDTWSPLNNGDMLERAYLLAYRSGWREDAGLELALHMATHAGAQVVGAPRYGLQVGCDADLVLVDAECGPEAVVMHPPRRLVLKRGRVVARDGRCVLSAIG